ncbi:MAG: FAD-dependent oxidoreductase [Gemmatimonadaceae bacterium]|nr:FAD-dependent oxidoreductase [Gemmatimonadaceae bacterium]
MSSTPARPRIVILGGGPAGCGAALELVRSGKANATLIERGAVVGGNAGSFEWAGQRLDYGSHRLHHATDPSILSDIKALLGDDLVSRERHGRIRLRGQWVHFPPQALDLLRRLDRRFALGMLRDVALGPLRRRHPAGPESFASVLLQHLGPTMCEQFYFPYARKIWGAPPEALSAIQARKRVSAATISKLVRRVIRPPGAGRFYYPRRGFGQITESFADAARGRGAELLLGWSVTSVRRAGASRSWVVVAERDGAVREIPADQVWSTIPITLLARMTDPPPPPGILEATEQIVYRAMVLVYLKLDVPRFSATDAHYFPEENVAMTRLSEPKNYSGTDEPAGSTVLCAEIPCATTDPLWSMADDAMGQLVAEDMARAGLTLPRAPSAVLTRRLAQAYPIYRRGYEGPFGELDRWSSSVPGLLVFGRQGLFAHDNTHHALFMAYAAVDCLRSDGSFDQARWDGHYRPIFATHVVED